MTDFYVNDIKCPKELLSEETIAKLVVLLFPCKVKQAKWVHVRKTHFFRIFKENNIKLRNEFFNDPLIKHLWGAVYLEKHQSVLVNYLRHIRSGSDNGEAKYNTFMRDIRNQEIRSNCTILPSPLIAAEIEVFT